MIAKQGRLCNCRFDITKTVMLDNLCLYLSNFQQALSGTKIAYCFRFNTLGALHHQILLPAGG